MANAPQGDCEEFVVTVAKSRTDEGLLNAYAVFWHIWPQHAVIDGELRQVGFEMEFMGSHSTDPNHLDPGCRECHQVRFTLLALAEHLADRKLSKLNGSATYEIDPHWTSIICSPGSGCRPSVSVSIMVTRKPAFARTGSNGDDIILDDVKRYMVELGIPEH